MSAIWRQIIQKQGHSIGRLDGKGAVISGATSRIGQRIAEVFVAEGAKIVIAGRHNWSRQHRYGASRKTMSRAPDAAQRFFIGAAAEPGSVFPC